MILLKNEDDDGEDDDYDMVDLKMIHFMIMMVSVIILMTTYL